jgi:hypothetical protein
MSGLAALFAAVALLPVMAGPVEPGEEHVLSLALCGGGTLTVPVRGEPDDVPANTPCAKGCHSGNCRKRAGGAA